MSGALMAKTTADVRDVLAAHGAPRRSPDGSGLMLRRARPDDKQFAGRLLREALTPELADTVFGLGVEGGATRYLERLFARAGTLWSYDLVTLVEVDGQVAGLVSHAAWTELAQRYRATSVGLCARLRPCASFRASPTTASIDPSESARTPGPLVHSISGRYREAPRKRRSARLAGHGLSARSIPCIGVQSVCAGREPAGAPVL